MDKISETPVREQKVILLERIVALHGQNTPIVYVEELARMRLGQPETMNMPDDWMADPESIGSVSPRAGSPQ